MLDVHKIVDDWEKTDKPKYEKLGEIVVKFIKSTIPEYEILPEVTHRTKDTLSIIKKIKKKIKEKEYSYNHLNDKLGIRIICSFQEDMQKIDDFLQKYFKIIKPEYKRDSLDFDRLDYISNHYDTCIKISVEHFENHKEYENMVFEIQVRTLNQHAWSNSAHSLSYKQEAEVAPQLKRRIYRLLSLYEIADDEFSAVHNTLKTFQDDTVITILKQLEGKIFKYAKVDYDRESALKDLKIILGYFGEKEKRNINHQIEEFIRTNEDKIQRIFDENRNRFIEIPFLTQPEIFLIWFGLEKYQFSITDNWNDDFQPSELETISTLWGKTID